MMATIAEVDVNGTISTARVRDGIKLKLQTVNQTLNTVDNRFDYRLNMSLGRGESKKLVQQKLTFAEMRKRFVVEGVKTTA